MGLIDVSSYDIVKILKTLFSSMTPTVVICTSEEIDANNFKLTCSDTSYLRTGSVFVHNENTYTVTSFEVNKELTIEGTPRITDELITLRNPFFITDTPQGANNELSIESANLELHPFVWLLENFPTNYQDPSNQYVGQSRVRLFFLDVSENNYWLNEDHRKECVEPMRNLINQFLVDLQYKVSGEINLSASNLSLTDRVRFGVYTGDKGNTKSIFNDQLSGVEVDINIPVKKYAADNCASLALIPSPIIQHNCTGTGGGGGGTTFFTDEFRLIDRASGDQIIFNAEGQTGDVTLYSFISGAFVTEPETPNISDPLEGAVFFFTPSLPETYQVIANHNPTSFALVGAPSSITIDNSGLISYDGGVETFTGSISITATNQFGAGASVSINVTISAGLQGSPKVVLSSLVLNAFNDGDTIGNWMDISGNSNDYNQTTESEKPIVKDDIFNVGVKGVTFNGITQTLFCTNDTYDIFPALNTTGSVFVVFRTPSSLLAQKQEICLFPETNGGATYVGLLLNGTYNTGNNGQSSYIADKISFRRQDRNATRRVINRDLTLTPNTTYIVRIFWGGGSTGMQFDKLDTPSTTTDTGDGLSSVPREDAIPDLGHNSILATNYMDVSIGLFACYDTVLTQVQIDENYDFIDSIWT